MARIFLTSIPVSAAVRVDSLRSAVASGVDVFVFRAVGAPEHFAGGSDVCGVSHLLMAVVPPWMALGWVFESLQTQIEYPTRILCVTDMSPYYCNQEPLCGILSIWQKFVL